MTLQTHEEQDIMRRLKRVEATCDILLSICMDILCELRPQEKYTPTVAVTVTPLHADSVVR